MAATASALLVAALLAALLGACSSSKSSSTSTPSSSGNAAAASGPTTSVTLALDYIANNASFAGFYVAQQMGYYSAAGLKVNIVPYTDTTADILVNAGKANFGTIDQASLILDRAAGQPLTSIMDIMQHDPQRLAVASKDSGISSPKALSDKTFGGFGIPMEKVMNDQTIKAAGGTPSYKTITLGASVYDALTSGQVDWAIPYETDDILWAKMRGHPWQVFNPLDFGMPDQYAKLLFSSDSYLKSHGDIATKFVAATMKGFDWAQHQPGQAIQIQSKLVQGAFTIPEQTATAQDLATNYWLDPSGKIGPEVADRWTKYVDFMTKNGILKDGSGKTLTTTPDSSNWFTNQYLPAVAP
jgi:ABC-type nitrate/sulfonate/bicarbonate transport system substrate-binding protein